MSNIVKPADIPSAISILKEGAIGTLAQKKRLLQDIEADDFVTIMREVIASHDEDTFDSILYYLFLFREDARVQSLINNLSQELEVLDDLIVFAFGRAVATGKSVEDVVESVLYFLDQEVFLQLLLDSPYVSKDRYLTMLILTKLDAKSIDIYFGEKEKVEQFIQAFIQLPEQTIRDILYRNPALFGFFRLFGLGSSKDIRVDNVLAKFSAEIDSIDKAKKIALHASRLQNSEDTNSPTDSERLKFLVGQISKTENISETIRFLDSTGVFIDTNEKSLVSELIGNPLLVQTYKEMTKSANSDVLPDEIVDFF